MQCTGGRLRLSFMQQPYKTSRIQHTRQIQRPRFAELPETRWSCLPEIAEFECLGIKAVAMTVGVLEPVVEPLRGGVLTAIELLL